MSYATMEGIVPSRCRLTTRHLGATLFKLRLYQICKFHVATSMHHDTWGLMKSHFYWPYWRPDSSHCNEPALGVTNCLIPLYIEGSTTQLVKHKAFNLVDVGSSPMMRFTSYDVLYKEVYIKSQLNIILLSRPLGATLVEIFMSIRQLQVPGCCKHDNPALGGYRWYTNKGGITSNSQFWANQVLYYYRRNLQSLWPGVIIRLTRHQQQLWPGVINIYKTVILAIITSQPLHL